MEWSKFSDKWSKFSIFWSFFRNHINSNSNSF
nr:MAG TPA: hypothetical protein [Caudoviricetes sp.]